MDPVRIAVVCEFGTLLGGERSLLAIAPLIETSCYQITWVAPPNGELAAELCRQQARHVPLDADSLRQAGRLAQVDQSSILKFLPWIDSIQPHLIHGNSLAMARLLGRLAPRIPSPVTGHLRDIMRLSRQAVADLNQNAALMAVSQATRDAHVAQGVEAFRVEVVYNGIDDPLVPQVDPSERDAAVLIGNISDPATPRDALRRRSTLREELRLPQDSFLMATIGQIGLRKAQVVLARALVHWERLRRERERSQNHAVCDTHEDPEWHWLLVGERFSDKTESREHDADITAVFAEAGLSNRLHRLGSRSDVPQLLRQINLLVHPARQEPFGRVLLEGAAAGVPIVATRVGGTPELLTHEHSALLVPPDDPVRLAESIDRLFHDRGLRDRLGAAARHDVLTRFPLSACADGCLRIWRRVVESQGHGPSSFRDRPGGRFDRHAETDG